MRDPTSRRATLARYLAASLIVSGGCGSLLYGYGAHSERVETTEADSAILVDLPPALASSQPAQDAAEGPEHQASDAAPPAVPRDPLPPKLVEAPKTDLQAPPVEHSPPPPPPAPNPATTIETPQEKPEIPPPVTTAPSAAQVKQAPPGAETPVVGKSPDNEGQPHASARAISAWQRALVGRVEGAKRVLARRARAIGTVDVAFAVDRDGRLVSERIARSSGSASLDETAMLLVKHAAPFPVPPLGTGDTDLSFILPVRFRR